MSTETLAPFVTHRDPKGRKFGSIVEAAYDKANLTDDEAQLVNDTPGLSELVSGFIEKNRNPNQFIKEEVASTFGYLSGYQKPGTVEDQIDILRSHWPTLNPDAAIRYMRNSYPTLELPAWLEGPFAFIRPGFFSEVYGEEVEEVLKALAKSRNGRFENYRAGEMGPDHLRQSTRTTAAINRVIEQQPGSDILIIPEQFGIRHRGRSVRRARETFIRGEFGEGAKNVGTMILTHPTRLKHFDDLWLDCPGDEFSPGADGQFSNAPLFRFYDDQVEFGTAQVSDAREYYGSVSGFVPQLE